MRSRKGAPTTADKQVLTITKNEWDDEAAMRAAETAGRAAVQAGADDVLANAQRTVPYATGALSESGRVVLDDSAIEAAVVYDTEYAHILRAHPEWDFQWGRSGRWLDEAIEQSSSVEQSMQQAASSAWPSG